MEQEVDFSLCVGGIRRRLEQPRLVRRGGVRATLQKVRNRLRTNRSSWEDHEFRAFKKLGDRRHWLKGTGERVDPRDERVDFKVPASISEGI